MDFKKILTFSFDDGVTQDERFVEILNKYGLKCTFNLNSELLGKDGYLMINGKKIAHNKVAPNKVKELYKGHEVAAHTLTHPNLTTLSPQEIIRQVEGDRCNLSNIVEYDVKGFAYPCGGINSNCVVANLIKNNTSVEYARTIVHSYSFSSQNNLFLFNPTLSLTKNKQQLLGKADDFLNSETEDIKLFYIWGHSYELDIDNSWDYFEEVCKKLSGKNDVLYCTNKQAFDYLNNQK